jgi:hypothetical protein
MIGFASCFAELKDPRSSGIRRHDLIEVPMIALCAVLSGGQTAVDMAVFAEAKQEFLGRFLKLNNGIPSHDTFSRVFRQLDPDQFRACFRNFVTRFGETCTGVIAIDGKTLRRSFHPSRACSALHMISAPGPATNAWFSPRLPPTPNRRRVQRYLNYWICFL